MNTKTLYLITLILLACNKNNKIPLIQKLNLPKSSILGFSNKTGIIIKDYAFLSKSTKKSSELDYDYAILLRKDEVVKIEKTLEKTERYGIEGNWILVNYKGTKSYIFSKDINIVNNLIIEHSK
ncbi:hypothetical protein PT136_04170 [Borreliella garinii]|uniref:Lipoprotein n=1 Tax=Borreliella garinii PBr TaxID=498743 RepID=B7XTR0_BORGR|nr:hypothetical protein [Borreliella garinii]EED28707.1 putative lipoprotein [Borreliella garinii PBr]EED29811.1 putative lipoprotein [Borreliella garinii Far04]WNZ67004.1 hypothetical protein PT139_04165 [Borreliella garinii]WNZ68001.1 hypothetical protein PT135_04160 [Borreliella garinii]WNZ68995.1 hypothetical protein PT138_04155 [Borreliella garinii]